MQTHRSSGINGRGIVLFLLSLFWWYGGSVFGVLVITEIYIDGTDEWIEITNTAESPFSGSFSLQGAKSSILSYSGVVLGPGESMLLGDQCVMMTDPLVCMLNQGLSLTDTKEITLLLTEVSEAGETIQTTTHFPTDLVLQVNDTKTSLSCYLPDCAVYTPTDVAQSTHILPGYSAHPGVTFSPPVPDPQEPILFIPTITHQLSGNILTFSVATHDVVCEEICTLLFTGSLSQTVTLQVMSGQVWTYEVTLTGGGQSEQTLFYSLGTTSGLLLTGQYIVPLLDNQQDIQTGIQLSGDQEEIQEKVEEITEPNQPELPHITISEIHPTNDTFPEYIELVIASPISGLLSLAGAGNGTATKTITIQSNIPQRLIITTKHIPGVDNQYILSSLSLTDSGEEISLLRQSGHQIDKAVYLEAKKGFSYYHSSGSGLDKNFTRFGTPTPGMSEELYHLLFSPTTTQPPTCEILFQHKTPLYAHHKVNIQAGFNKTPLTNSAPYTCHRSLSGEVFTGCNPSFLTLPQPGIYTLDLTIYSALDTTPLCATTTQINLPELPKTQSCRAEYYSGLYTTWKEKYGVLSSAIRAYGFRISGSGTNITLTSRHETTGTTTITGILHTGAITITQLIPNPVGEDRGNEWIEIYVASGNIVSGSLLLSNGTSTFRFPPNTITAGELQGFTGNWGLLNKQACIILAGSGIIYDTYCYSTPKEGLPAPRKVGVNSPTALSTIKGITLAFVGDQACIKHHGQIYTCKDLLITKATLKELKKETKKTTTLQKKLTSAYTRKEKYKKVASQFTAYKKKQKQQLTDLKQKYQRSKDTLFTLKSYLHDRWGIVAQDTYIKTLYSLFSHLDTNEQQTPYHYQSNISTANITEIHTLSLGNILYDTTPIPTLVEYLAPFIQSYINKAIPEVTNPPP